MTPSAPETDKLPQTGAGANVRPGLAAHSRFVQRIRRRYANELTLLAPGLPSQAHMISTLRVLNDKGYDLGAGLRILRQLVIERLAVLDCECAASAQDVTQTATTLAEFTLDKAVTAAQQSLKEIHGAPMIDPDSETAGEPKEATLWVVGMGKLGARELNVSSDIDLIYVYDGDGRTTGNAHGLQRISNQAFFAKVVRQVYQLIGESTEHGFVFRVDLALRPNGSVGPAASALDALETYFVVQGREWERFAWLKSRVVAPAEARKAETVFSLRDVVLPFVFRRYLDYNVFEGLRRLHQQIRVHATKRASGHPERANDVKLSRGGIREIEFTVQLLQVVRGGRFPELRTRSTLDALDRLAKADLMPPETATALAQAYVFLRQVEHRAQYLDDQQTHMLPVDDGDLAWIAQSMAYPQTTDFLCALAAHRETVAQEFDRLLGNDAPCTNCDGSQRLEGDLDAVFDTLTGAFKERIDTWRANPRVLGLREDVRIRLARLIQRTHAWLVDGHVSETGAVRLADWLEALMRRDSYLALLHERPGIHERLLRLLSAAKWPARYLIQHPSVIDELANATMLDERFDAAQFESELESRRAALIRTGEDGEEELLNLLRRAHHSEVFRTLARDVEGRLSVEWVADDLSALADTVLKVAMRWCWALIRQRHREVPAIAILAYGKLGGKELGYGSDLDIVFVYEDPHDNAPVAYAALVRKLINWLTVKTAEGDLFEIDTALRPNGNSGMLVTRMDSYADYQQQRGSNTAWTWEHQAITRARSAVGDPALKEAFDAVREAVMIAPRDLARLREEITSMRARVRQAHPVPAGLFDVKHSVGGMVDVEFVVQYLLLAHSKDHPALRPNVGNIKLLRIAQMGGLLPEAISDSAADAYRSLRQIQHRARLDETATQVPVQDARAYQEAITALWRTVFGP